MEGKTVILSVLIMSLVMAHNQVEATSCCPSSAARWAYYLCTMSWPITPLCISHTGCIDSETCPPGYPYAILENSGHTVNEYCKLGCASSACGALTKLQKSDANEIVNGAVARCTNACSNFCTKGLANAVEAS
ncbi:putative thionin-2.4 [Raphanus sativus]|uniref:Probable thionin-2.4 n=1 Tax=Raphanus sativus TaxID=3726 RepID=A0A6J0MXK8_RAPSA|nr:probable thionin-2.4 [Raphanus sativus]XP_018476871.1 probable thionin-2.4 [Raphanus sativus]XP_056860856.1 probable thionin-2.4 [Raphanus sativus]KAJ4907287.1 putative thionin-2.4 [Raphanus sativus]